MHTYLKNAIVTSCVAVAAIGAIPVMSASADYGDSSTIRLRKLEDIEQIKQLKHRYVELIDDVIASPAAAQDFVDLFITNFQVDYDAYGTFTTKASLKAFLQNVISPAFAWGFHTAANPIIEVNGDCASATWYLVAQTVAEGDDKVVPYYGRYEDEYVRTWSGWKFKSSTLVFDFPPI